MNKAISQQKAFHTALVLSPPPEFWPQIQETRKLYDSAYERWMPHINLLFPFVNPNDFEETYSLLQSELKNFPSFQIEFNKLGYFQQAKKCVLWAGPETKEKNLEALEDLLIKILPFCDDLTKKSEDGFHPHLTLGQSDKNNIAGFKSKIENNWKPISFSVKEIYMIQRTSQTTPFFVSKALKLNGSDDKSFTDDINNEMKKLVNTYYQTNNF